MKRMTMGVLLVACCAYGAPGPENESSAKSIAGLRGIIKTNVDAHVRYEAVVALAAQGEEAVPLLLETLRDKSAGVRYAATQALGERGREMQPAALALLKDGDLNLRVMGAVMLRHMGSKADTAVTVPALVKALEDRHFDVRLEAAEALGVLGDLAVPAVPALLAAVHDEEWWVRDSVFQALASIRTSETMEGLIGAMTEERHPAVWFGNGGFVNVFKEFEKDPAMQRTLLLMYGKLLLKGDVDTPPFAARSKFGGAVVGLERYVKESIPIPAETADTIRRILSDESLALWTIEGKVGDKTREKLEAILAAEKK